MPDQTSPAPTAALTREERLAAKLRENLRRRKTQARALSRESDAGNTGDVTHNPAAPQNPPQTLSKPGPKS